MLTPEEQDLVTRMFSQGSAALDEAGFTDEDAILFKSREDVQRFFLGLQHEFSNQEVIFRNTEFVLRRKLTRLGDGAAAVLAQALIGPQYARNAQGNVLTDATGRAILSQPEPTKQQVAAAKTLLDRLDVVGDHEMDKGQVNVNVLFRKDNAEPVTLDLDPKLKTEEELALSRERIRNVIEGLRTKLPGLRLKDSEPEPKKKRPTKKATAKPVKKKKKATKKAKKKAKKKATAK